MDEIAATEVLVFEGFRLDPRQRLLFNPEGAAVPLGARAFDVLLYFLEHPHRLIERQTLMKAIWPSTIVEENTLNQNISALRRALGELPGEHRFIVTVSGRGFRFVPTVARQHSAAAQRAPSPQHLEARVAPGSSGLSGAPTEVPESRIELRKGHKRRVAAWIAAVAGVGLSAVALMYSFRTAPRPEAGTPGAGESRSLTTRANPDGPQVPRSTAHYGTTAASVAVIPFANLTGESNHDYLSDGLAGELISELTRVPGLKVPARTSSFAYKGRNLDARQIGHDLGVATILEGSVFAAGERIRVTVQLVDTRSGFDIWSQTYDRKFGDIFELEDDISARIVAALRSALNAPLVATATRVPATHDAQAYRLYLQGRAERPPGSFLLLQQAIARDPDFALPHAVLAEARISYVSFGYGMQPNLLAEVEREARKAIALDPTLSEAYSALGIVNDWRGQWLEGEADFHKAMTLDSSDPAPLAEHATFALTTTGHLAEALRQMEQVYALAPADRDLVAGLSGMYMLLGRDADALRSADLAAALGAGDHPLVFIARTWSNVRSGRYKQAAEIDVTNPWVSSTGGTAIIKRAYEAIGEPSERSDAARALRAYFQQLSAERLAQNKEEAILVPALIGDLDLAFDSANRVLNEYAQAGTVGTTWGILWLPETRTLRNDARFQGLVARLKLFDYWRQFGPPDGCVLEHGRLSCR